MKGFFLEWCIQNEQEGMLLREYLLKEKKISKRALVDLKFRGGDILLNNQHVTVRQVLTAGDVVKVQFPPEQRSDAMIGEKIPLHIVYEDDFILVINKPPFMASIPSREHPRGTLANGLLYYYDQIHLPSTVHIVNRLDRDTSGLMIVAKHKIVHSLFSMEQKKKAVRRVYHAIVHGIVTADEGVINAPIGRKDESIVEREVRSDGQHAVTHFKVLQRLEELQMTFLSLRLETGRTHQIRVHMSYYGHPLVGDELYGGRKDWLSRQALHSHYLHFFHPLLQKHFEFSAPIPNDMKRIISKKNAM